MQESYKIKQDKTATISEFRNQYYFLSNFYKCSVSYDGITYRNAEAAFQAQKTLDIDIRKQFGAMSAREAKKQGRRISLRKDWEDVKVDIMQDIVLAKFEQNPELLNKLIETDGMYLIEGNTWGDKTWGMVGNKGMNLLGKILMETREKIMNKIQSLTFLDKCLEKANNSTKEEIARFKEIYLKECSEELESEEINMLKIINITSKNDIINMEVLIEGDIANNYKLCVDSKDDVFPVIDSEIPDEYKIYERQARIALRRYPDKTFPNEIVSSWY